MYILFIYLKKYFLGKRLEWLKFDSVFMNLGIIISVAALCTTIIIFEGYEKHLKETILGVNAHIYFFPRHTNVLEEEELLEITEFLQGREEVKAFSGVISGQAITTKRDRSKGAIFKSIDWRKTYKSSMYSEAVVEGKWQLENENDVVIGKYLANNLNATIGDEIILMSTSSASLDKANITYRTKRMKIVGIFYSGMYEYDSRYIFLNTEIARHFEAQDTGFTLVEVMLNTQFINKADRLSSAWDREFTRKYQVHSWIFYNGNLFSLITLEKWVLTIIISFLIVVASFNVITTTLASIKTKRKEIGLLKTIGLNGRKIAYIFLGQININAIICIIIGIFTGIALGYLISYQTLITLRGDVYLLDKIYIHANFLKMCLIFGIAFIIINISSIIPLVHISRLKEIEILRYRK